MMGLLEPNFIILRRGGRHETNKDHTCQCGWGIAELFSYLAFLGLFTEDVPHINVHGHGSRLRLWSLLWLPLARHLWLNAQPIAGHCNKQEIMTVLQRVSVTGGQGCLRWSIYLLCQLLLALHVYSTACLFNVFFLPRFLGAYVTLLKYAERTYSRNDRAAL